MTSRSEREAWSPAAQAAGFSLFARDRPAVSVQDFRPEPPRAFARCSPTPSPEHRIVPKTGNHFWVRCSPYERGASRPSQTLPMKGQGKAPPPQTPPPMEGLPLQTSPFAVVPNNVAAPGRGRGAPLSLTSDHAPATPASRTSRSPQFSTAAQRASPENRLPRSPPLAVASRSLTPRGYSAGSFRQNERRNKCLISISSIFPGSLAP